MIIFEYVRQQCIFLGTFASQPGSYICKPCSANTYALKKGSDKCLPCDEDDEYSGKNFLKN